MPGRVTWPWNMPLICLLICSSRIFQISKLGTKIKQDSIPLSYTPRKMVSHPTNGYFYVIEGDHRVMGEDAIAKGLAEQVNTYTCINCLYVLTVFGFAESAGCEN